MATLKGKSAVIMAGETCLGLAVSEALSAAGVRISIGGILESPSRHDHGKPPSRHSGYDAARAIAKQVDNLPVG